MLHITVLAKLSSQLKKKKKKSEKSLYSKQFLSIFVQMYPSLTLFSGVASWKHFERHFEKKKTEYIIKIYKIRQVVNEVFNAKLIFTKFHRTKTRGLSLTLLEDIIKLDKISYFFSVGRKLLVAGQTLLVDTKQG